MMTRLLAAAAALALTAGAAVASETSLTATLAQPVASPAKFVAGGAVWNCEGDTCVSGVATSRTMSVRACAALAREVGPIASYGGRNQMEAERLAKCNASVVARAPASTAVAAN